MNQATAELIKEKLQPLADEMQLQLISCRYLPNGEMGPTLEIFVDKDYSIDMQTIDAFTERANPIIDEIADDDDAYMLDISSGGSAREIPFADIAKLKEHYLDIKLKASGETITAKVLDFDGTTLSVFYFIKGRKKILTLTQDQIEVIHMGYKA